jgi:CheY-like chemotaxis protein
MDSLMPVMDGRQATAIIRAMGGRKSTVPIIAMTTDINTGDIHENKNLGINHICTKPINIPTLLKIINDQLGEEIHRSLPQVTRIISSQIATGAMQPHRRLTDNKDLEPQANSFAQVLDRVVQIIDQNGFAMSDNEAQHGTASILGFEKFAELVEMYEARMSEQYEDLLSAYDSLAKNPDNIKLRNNYKMLIHSLKGGGSSFGYNLISTIAGQADQLLRDHMILDTANILALGYYTQSLSLVTRKKLSGNGGQAGRILLQGLIDFA